MGCKLVQGYYFAKPLTAKAAEEFVISKVAPAKVPLPRPTAA
jgi:EAL domain-containing protein (putative c-di-GMP-specific phosphodiesterase class I)